MNVPMSAQGPLRFSCDTGGTFTDLLVEDERGEARMYKAPTTPHDPIDGVLDALGIAAADYGLSLPRFLAQGSAFIHGTTHAINAIITGRTPRTAFLTTEGHRDILVIREGGRKRAFDHSIPYPQPYVPRRLTFEVPGRFGPDGRELRPFDESKTRAVIRELQAQEVEAVGVCLLWSIVDPSHEERVAELLRKYLPGVAYTLSHRLNPTLREYRRASSTVIDASLKPLMSRYLGDLERRMRESGFAGRVLALTSQGGVMNAADLATTPIHAINSGPALAPIAGAYYCKVDGGSKNAIVADTGGTTYDVSLVRDSVIPWTRETWIGRPFEGHMTGFPSVDVKSIGAGGGSIAWVDDGGLLHVGPESAGAVPGPACYGKGGASPTVADAALVLGYLDPDFFLGGSIKLEKRLAAGAIEKYIASPLRMTLAQAAWAIINVVTENMVSAILDITVNQGVDPAAATLIGGGGAAGLNSVWIARRLKCPTLLIPQTGAALSAAGALISDLATEHRITHFTTAERFDFPGVARVLEELRRRSAVFASEAGANSAAYSVTLSVEARYENQVWEIPVELPSPKLATPAELAALVEAFHRNHSSIFAIDDRSSDVEFLSWIARVRCRLRPPEAELRLRSAGSGAVAAGARTVYFADTGVTEAPVYRMDGLLAGSGFPGPAIIESSFTTIVIDSTARLRVTGNGGIVIHP